MQMPVSIIIADDCDAYRKGLEYLFTLDRQVVTTGKRQVLATAANGVQLIEAVHLHQPDIAFIDLRMPVMDGIAACLQLEQLYPQVGKIVLTMYDHDYPDVQAILKAGARGFLSKDVDMAQINRCIDTVLDGGIYYSSSVTCVVNPMLKGQTNMPALQDFELELLRLIGESLSSEEIAVKMCKSVHTISAWRQALMQKCGAKNVVGLVLFGVQHGIIKVSNRPGGRLP
jgi:two-component system, NarL family, invasion response regulator UvrY